MRRNPPPFRERNRRSEPWLKRKNRQQKKTYHQSFQLDTSRSSTLRSKIQSAQGRAMNAVNKELIEVYRDIGKTIHEQQEGSGWGDAIVKTFASDLQKKFPGIKGFSYRNIYTMRYLYTSFKDSEKLQTLSAQISWSHNVAILSKCKDPLEKEFYMKMSKRNG